MEALTSSQLALLIPLTLVWGLNWPVLGVVLLAMKVPLRIPRRHWPELLVLGATNMFVWHACIIVALKELPSGRAAILGYTMPIFSALLGVWRP